MDITIVDSSAAENLRKNYDVQWKLSLARYRNQSLIYLIAVGFLITSGVFELFSESYHSFSVFEKGVDGVFLPVGITGLIVLVYRYYTIIQYNKANVIFIEGVSMLLQKGDNQLIMKLTDESVSVDQYKNTEQLGWEYFNHYTVYENLIILHINRKIIQNYVIRREQITESEYNEILDFVSNKLERYNY